MEQIGLLHEEFATTNDQGEAGFRPAQHLVEICAMNMKMEN